MQLGRLVARTVIGGLFIGHGTQKLFGWFGGPGLAGTEQMMHSIEMRPTRRNAYAAGASEAVGGAMLLAGAATPAAAAALIGTMITAVRKVHQPNGPWVANGGWEYNAVLIAALLELVDAGPGDVSVDAAIGRERFGPAWTVGALLTGAVASTAAIALGARGPAHTDNAPGGGPVAAAAADNGTGGDPVTTAS